LRSILWETTKKYLDSLPDDLPPSLRERHQLPDIQHSIRMIHFPEVPETREKSESPTLSDDLIKNLMDFNTPSHHRLIYEEFLKFEYMILKQRLRLQKENAQAVSLTSAKKTVQHFLNKLPFQLTGDQQLALKDILDDLSQPHPMNRLIQGDVGSGKTVIALLSAAVIYSEGGQTVLMAPTEILAEQHFHNALRLFGTELQIKLLTGKTTANDRKTILAQCASGQPILIIGTHAVIEDPVIFKNLQLIMIDEQHRFGVEQRLKLKQKGYQIDPKTKQSLHPHNIVLTATPIPRTLALTAYGDLDTSIIKEMPPGRTPIRTRVVRGPTRSKAYDFIREQIQKGRQAYFIYPLVSDSEAEGFTHLKSAETDYLRLQKEVFPDLKIGLLHGQMKNQEKVDIMEQFKKGELHILVSTTVIEVGVDVPNATVMAVEHSERFGLSQLHQLRGRVGRGSHQSYCFFFTKESLAEPTAERLDVLEKSTDGFEIAEADLRIRGPGEFLGTKQSGDFPFKIGDLLRDRDWLIKARDDAEWLLRTDPELLLQEHKPLRSYFEQEGKVHFEMLKTS
jgi:ATP-dependent DNA helicase RecG